MEPLLDDSSSPCKLVKCWQVALLCVQENLEDRLTMLEIYSMLKNQTKATSNPKRPAFTEKSGGNVQHTSTSQQAGMDPC